jgi:hypothetical protein
MPWIRPTDVKPSHPAGRTANRSILVSIVHHGVNFLSLFAASASRDKQLVLGCGAITRKLTQSARSIFL